MSDHLAAALLDSLDDAVPATPEQEAEYRRLAEKWDAP